MSCIAHYEILNKAKFSDCLLLAGKIQRVEKGWWIFKRVILDGEDEFQVHWEDSVVENGETFRFSGYTFATLELFLEEFYSIKLSNGTHEDWVRSLEKVFMGSYIFEAEVQIPEIDIEKLRYFCNRDYSGENELPEAMLSARNFIINASTKTDPNRVVVIILN